MAITGEPGGPPLRTGNSVADINAGLLAAFGILATPYQAFPTATSWIIIGGANDKNWTRIAQVLGQPQWIEDARFRLNSDRMRHRDELTQAISAILRQRPAWGWLAEFDKAGVPAGPVHSIAEALSHPQTLARDMVVRQRHPQAGEICTLGMPVKFSATPARYRRAAPRLGEDTLAILGEYGYDEAGIRSLLDRGIARDVRG